MRKLGIPAKLNAHSERKPKKTSLILRTDNLLAAFVKCWIADIDRTGILKSKRKTLFEQKRRGN